VLIAHLDETGHSGDSDYVGVAGIIARSEEWESFDGAWNDLLVEYSVQCLHMREIAHCRGQFSGWSEAQRRGFLGDALALVRKLNGMVVGSMLPMGIWHNTLTSRQRKGLVDPYFPCLQEVLTTIAIKATVGQVKSKVVVASNTEFAFKADKWREALQTQAAFAASVDPDWRFASASDIPGLQVADLVAYEFLKAVRMQEAGKEPNRWPFLQLIQGERHLHLLNQDFLKLRLPSDEILSRIPGFSELE
jgi:hypothetical protein